MPMICPSMRSRSGLEQGNASMGSVQDEYLLLLGSNHRRAFGLRLAVRRLSERFDVLACSGTRRTRDGDGPRYLNAAMRISTYGEWSIDDLRQQLRSIEAEAGRVRGDARCALDIDLAAKCRGHTLIEVYKAEDLRRDYILPLLSALDIRSEL
jgi:7,8-dihydro-6-hydroxymethylpterin-pyrophosphokinase